MPVVVRVADLCGSGSTHSRHAGSDFPSLDLGDGSFARVSGTAAVGERTGHRTALKFIPIFRGVGSLIPGLARVHLRQKSPRCIAKGLQNSILSAGRTGLARGFDGHESTGRKIGNVRKHSGEIRNERR